MAKQRLVWTVLPNGYVLSDRTGMTFKFSVFISPRLISSDPSPTLAEFPDWAGTPPPPDVNLPPGPRPWPTTLQGVTFQLFLRDINGGLDTYLAASRTPTRWRRPTPVQWNALFPTTTPVTPYGQTQDQKGYDHRRLRSFPVGNIADFLASRYGQFGLNTPTEFPSYDDLVQNTAFGPIGFEGGADDTGGNGDGPTRKQRLIADLESQFDVGPGSTPADWAIPYDPNTLASVDGMGEAFLQLEQFLKRDLKPVLAPNTHPATRGPAVRLPPGRRADPGSADPAAHARPGGRSHRRRQLALRQRRDPPERGAALRQRVRPAADRHAELPALHPRLPRAGRVPLRCRSTRTTPTTSCASSGSATRRSSGSSGSIPTATASRPGSSPTT